MTVEVLKQYQKKYTIVCELYRLTKEIEQLLSVDDRVSTSMVLEMRQEEMERADQCDRHIALLEESMDASKRQRIQQVRSHRGELIAETFEEKKIVELGRQIQDIFVKAIEIDKKCSIRIAGKDSYYYGK